MAPKTLLELTTISPFKLIRDKLVEKMDALLKLSYRHFSDRFRGRTLEECKELCVNEPSCVAFEYGVPHGGEGGGYAAKDCQLHAQSHTEGCDGMFNNVDAYVQTSCRHDDGEGISYITCDKFRCEIISVEKCPAENFLHRKF